MERWGKGSNIKFPVTPNNFDLIPQCLVHPSPSHTFSRCQREGRNVDDEMVDAFLQKELHPLRNDRDQLKCL